MNDTIRDLRKNRARILPNGEVEVLGTVNFSGAYKVSPDAGDVSFIYTDYELDDGWKPCDIYYKKFRNRAQIATGRKQRRPYITE